MTTILKSGVILLLFIMSLTMHFVAGAQTYIVLFGDPRCPHCGETIRLLQKEYPNITTICELTDKECLNAYSTFIEATGFPPEIPLTFIVRGNTVETLILGEIRSGAVIDKVLAKKPLPPGSIDIFLGSGEWVGNITFTDKSLYEKVRTAIVSVIKVRPARIQTHTSSETENMHDAFSSTESHSQSLTHTQSEVSTYHTYTGTTGTKTRSSDDSEVEVVLKRRVSYTTEDNNMRVVLYVLLICVIPVLYVVLRKS